LVLELGGVLDALVDVGAEIHASELQEALWDLVWAGEVTNDAWAPLRAPRLSLARGGGRGGLSSRGGARRFAPAVRSSRAQTRAPVQGRWSLAASLFEPAADPALVAGRPVRSIDPQRGLFVDDEGNSYRLAGGGQAKPDYAEVIPVNEGLHPAGTRAQISIDTPKSAVAGSAVDACPTLINYVTALRASPIHL